MSTEREGKREGEREGEGERERDVPSHPGPDRRVVGGCSGVPFGLNTKGFMGLWSTTCLGLPHTHCLRPASSEHHAHSLQPSVKQIQRHEWNVYPAVVGGSAAQYRSTLHSTTEASACTGKLAKALKLGHLGTETGSTTCFPQGDPRILSVFTAQFLKCCWASVDRFPLAQVKMGRDGPAGAPDMKSWSNDSGNNGGCTRSTVWVRWVRPPQARCRQTRGGWGTGPS